VGRETQGSSSEEGRWKVSEAKKKEQRQCKTCPWRVVTTAKLDELEKLLAKATPGPWDAHDYAEGGAGDRRYQIQERAGARRYDKTGSVLGYFEDEQVPTPEARANARLVAAMRSALPALIAKVRAAEELADAADGIGLDWSDSLDVPRVRGEAALLQALDAYRKTGQP